MNRRPTRPDLRDERGVTLVELLVALVLFGAVMGAFTTGIIAVQRASVQVDVRTDDLDQARTALEVGARALRAVTAPPVQPGSVEVPPPFLEAGPRYAVFTAYLGDPDTPVRIELDARTDGELIERTTLPSIAPDGTITWPVTGERQRVLARRLHDGAVLTYIVRDDDGTTRELTSLPLDGDRRRVERVRLDVTVGGDAAGRVRPHQLATEVRLPNRSRS